MQISAMCSFVESLKCSDQFGAANAKQSCHSIFLAHPQGTDNLPPVGSFHQLEILDLNSAVDSRICYVPIDVVNADFDGQVSWPFGLPRTFTGPADHLRCRRASRQFCAGDVAAHPALDQIVMKGPRHSLWIAVKPAGEIIHDHRKDRPSVRIHKATPFVGRLHQAHIFETAAHHQ
jgi:hypothetical protein